MVKVSEKGKALILFFCYTIATIASIISFMVEPGTKRIIRCIVLFFVIVVAYFDRKGSNSNKVSSNLFIISMVLQLLFQLFP